jgi:hypothetical protein
MKGKVHNFGWKKGWIEDMGKKWAESSTPAWKIVYHGTKLLKFYELNKNWIIPEFSTWARISLLRYETLVISKSDRYIYVITYTYLDCSRSSTI